MSLSWLRYKQAAEVVQRMHRRRINRYLEYWTGIMPRNHQEYYERWLFAFMSIRTTWQENIKLFEAIRLLPAGFTREHLQRYLVENRSGMLNNRTRGIWGFHRDFWENPTSWYPALGEPVSACRDRLIARIFGMGIAKVSFVMEMAFPSTCDVVCIDVHLARLYGLKGSERRMSVGAYHRIEEHWTQRCQDRDIPAAIARHVYWDYVQGQHSTSYWSHVFEKAG